jgi:molybdopterin-binding protein
MQISARNALKGRIKRITVGAVNTEILIELAGGAEMVSVITKTSADKMKLTEGSEAYAVVKASDVMIAVDH